MAPTHETRQPFPQPSPRLLAVCGLALASVLMIAVIAGSVGGSDSSSSPEPARSTTTGSERTHPGRKYYVIESGATFDAIAARFGIPPDRLGFLNPDLDPQGLQIGGCINLVPDGCKALAEGG